MIFGNICIYGTYGVNMCGPKKPPEKKKKLTSTAKVSTTAVAARECLRALARANASHVLPVVLEAPSAARYASVVFVGALKHMFLWW